MSLDKYLSDANAKPRRSIYLDDSEEVCDECQGTGEDFIKLNAFGYHPACKKCYGKGKLNWLEMIFN
jgi:DnaJ-class molecular chaperone